MRRSREMHHIAIVVKHNNLHTIIFDNIIDVFIAVVFIFFSSDIRSLFTPLTSAVVPMANQG